MLTPPSATCSPYLPFPPLSALDSPSAFANIGIYTIYLSTYSYLGDVYERYSSSAQAAQSLLRNLLGGVFPFFGVLMYDKLSFPVASSLVGAIAAVFAMVPFIILKWGETLRARSSTAVAMELQEGNTLRDEPDNVVQV